MNRMKWFSTLAMIMCALAFTACGDDGESDDGSGNSSAIVGIWRLAELKTETWMEKDGVASGTPTVSRLSYGMSNGIWEVSYVYDRDGSYEYYYLDGSSLKSQSGYYSFDGSSLSIGGETYMVSINGNVMEWSREAERRDLGGMLTGNTIIKWEYATWYKVD